MNTPIGDKLFQDIPCHVANFPENRSWDVENLVDGKKFFKNKQHDQNITVFHYRWSDTRATVFNTKAIDKEKLPQPMSHL